MREIGFVQESAGKKPSYLSNFIEPTVNSIAVGLFLAAKVKRVTDAKRLVHFFNFKFRLIDDGF